MKQIQRITTIGGVLALIAALAVAGTLYPFQAASPEAAKKDMAANAPPAMPVDVILAQFEPVRLWSDYSARLQAVDFVEVRPQVSGPIIEVKFRDGQIVNQGDVLFVIDPRPYKAAYDQAQADLQKSRNEYDLAVKDLRRAKELIKTQAIAARLFDERQSAANVAKSAVDAAQARVDQAKLNLDYTNVTAPVAGRTGREELTVGNLVDTGSSAPVLTTIVSNKGIYADFEMDEKTYTGVMRSQQSSSVAGPPPLIPVKLVIDQQENRDGYIQSFDNHIDTQSGTIRARALFDNADGALLPGMFVNVRVGSPEQEEHMLVPSEAIGTDQDRKFVYVVNDNNKVEYREVTLGAAVNGRRIVETGLKPREKVISGGIMKIRPDMPVDPKIQSADLPQAQPQLQPLLSPR